MKTGFTFKGKHSDDFGAVVKTVSRPITPEMKVKTYESGVMDGNYDFSCANVHGRAFYRNRIFTVSVQVSGDELSDIIQKVSRISAWLMGRGELIFDDTPLVKWIACVVNTIDYVPERRGKNAVLSVSLEVKPFAECLFNVADGPVLDSDIYLDTDMSIDIPSRFYFQPYEEKVKVYNMGEWYARPVFTYVSNEAICALGIQCGEKTLLICGIPEGRKTVKIVLDFENYTVTDDIGNLLNFVSGDFFELIPGENELFHTCNASEYSLSVDYRPKYMFDFTGGGS